MALDVSRAVIIARASQEAVAVARSYKLGIDRVSRVRGPKCLADIGQRPHDQAQFIDARCGFGGHRLRNAALRDVVDMRNGCLDVTTRQAQSPRKRVGRRRVAARHDLERT